MKNRMIKNGLLCILSACLVMSGGCGQKSETKAASAASETASSADVDSPKDSTQESDAASTGDETDKTFPMKLDNGNLLIESLFPFEGVNPDSSMQECEKAAGIELLNRSGKYLKKAEITLRMENIVYTFTVCDVPDGSELYAFDTKNQEYTGDGDPVSADAETSYEDSGSSLLGSSIEASSDGTSITLKNTGSEDYGTLEFFYHCVMDGTLFGGTSYSSDAGGLFSGESEEADADGAWLGSAEVVRVEEKEE